ncbi:MAG: alanine:cation symporter family protein [Eubacterium sp.]|nr:alanine:cation symporter family protein [Eubacterium sp.]
MYKKAAWGISDTFNGMMMIPNMIGVLTLSLLVLKITKNYVDRRIKGRTDIRPMLSHHPDIEAEGIRLIEETGEE